ncbi:MAG: GNAT family N-acetyltransferase, partial [Chloroflexi bacterium]|nr:GNAT family N-acetyltransferase [Chloroflexota bacterium]
FMESSEIIVVRGQTAVALDIIRETAGWLIECGKQMWSLEDITEKKVLAKIKTESICVGYVNNQPAAAMFLLWSDPLFWPDKEDSGFIHKLAVRRKYAGTGLSKQMIKWAENEARSIGKQYLRLDCAGDRPSLCSFYENLGFKKVDQHTVGSYDTAFYELKLE